MPRVSLLSRSSGSSGIRAKFRVKGYAVREGFKRVLPLPFDFVGNLDADVSFEATYFEELLKKFQADPGLGVGGGWISRKLTESTSRGLYNSRDWVPHAVQLLRRRCYEAVGDYVPLPYGGEDTWAVVDRPDGRLGGRVLSGPARPAPSSQPRAPEGFFVTVSVRGSSIIPLAITPRMKLLKCGRRLSRSGPI